MIATARPLVARRLHPVPALALACAVMILAQGLAAAEPTVPAQAPVVVARSPAFAASTSAPPSASTSTSISTSTLTLTSTPSSRQASEGTVSTRDLLARLNQPWVQLIDVRSTEEYGGRDIRALRGGHIPGAYNVPLGLERDPDAIAALLAPHLDSLDLRRETIVYGHVDTDAAQLAAWLQARGFRHVRVYSGGWQTWGNRLDLPAADERFADVNALRERITALEQALDRLSPARLAGR